MSGMRIDDHSDWIGGRQKGMPMPMHTKTKEFSSADSAGMVMKYEDTTEAIRMQQEIGERKAKSRPMKPSYRN
jgi:hypothetical protein